MPKKVKAKSVARSPWVEIVPEHLRPQTAVQMMEHEKQAQRYKNLVERIYEARFPDMRGRHPDELFVGHEESALIQKFGPMRFLEVRFPTEEGTAELFFYGMRMRKVMNRSYLGVGFTA